jgi:O-antigen ligase
MLAALMAIFPLLPAGPRYFGLSGAAALDAGFVALMIVWLVARVTGSRRKEPTVQGDVVVACAWAVFVAATGGAMLVGLAAENRIGSPVFDAHAADLLDTSRPPLDFSIDPFYSVRVWLTFLQGFLAFAAVRDCCRSADQPSQIARFAAWGWLAGLGTVSILAIAQYATRFQLHPEWVAVNASLVRAHATLDDPNALGSYLVLGIGLAVGVALAERRSGRARIAASVALLASVALVTTISRIAWAAVPATALLLVGFDPAAPEHPLLARLSRARRAARACCAGLVLIAGLLIVARLTLAPRSPAPPTSPVDALWQTIDPRVPLNDVAKNRLVYWDAALRMAAQRPVAGNGLGRYPRLVPQFRRSWVRIENTHNFVLQLLAEAGVLGVASFGAVLAVAIVVLVRTVRGADGAGAGVAFGMLFGTIGFATTLLTGHPLLLPSCQILFASALALGLAASTSRPHAVTMSRRRAWGAATVAILLVGGAYGVAAWRTPPPPQQQAIWGYSWGLFPEEGGFFPDAWGLELDKDAVAGPPGLRASRFRWSGPRAIIEMKSPEDAVECVVGFTAFLPSLGHVQAVRFSYGRTRRTFPVRTSDVQMLRIPLTPDVLDAERRLLIHVQVVPPFVPATLRLSDDKRKLGVQLFRPRWVYR